MSTHPLDEEMRRLGLPGHSLVGCWALLRRHPGLDSSTRTALSARILGAMIARVLMALCVVVGVLMLLTAMVAGLGLGISGSRRFLGVVTTGGLMGMLLMLVVAQRAYDRVLAPMFRHARERSLTRIQDAVWRAIQVSSTGGTFSTAAVPHAPVELRAPDGLLSTESRVILLLAVSGGVGMGLIAHANFRDTRAELRLVEGELSRCFAGAGRNGAAMIYLEGLSEPVWLPGTAERQGDLEVPCGRKQWARILVADEGGRDVVRDLEVRVPYQKIVDGNVEEARGARSRQGIAWVLVLLGAGELMLINVFIQSVRRRRVTTSNGPDNHAPRME